MERINRIIAHPAFVAAMKELKACEAAREYCVHDIEHSLNVARLMMIVNLEHNLRYDEELLYAAALLHDIGRVSQYKTGEDHALAGGEAAWDILPACGFWPGETLMIDKAIRTHNTDEPVNPLGELLQLCDKRSRNCFLCAAADTCKWPDEKKNRGITR